MTCMRDWKPCPRRQALQTAKQAGRQTGRQTTQIIINKNLYGNCMRLPFYKRVFSFGNTAGARNEWKLSMPELRCHRGVPGISNWERVTVPPSRWYLCGLNEEDPRNLVATGGLHGSKPAYRVKTLKTGSKKVTGGSPAAPVSRWPLVIWRPLVDTTHDGSKPRQHTGSKAQSRFNPACNGCQCAEGQVSAPCA